MISRFGSRETFMMSFNPDRQFRMCKDKKLCFMGDYPTLAELNMCYGLGSGAIWLVPQLFDLSEYCGVREKMNGYVLEQCAQVIDTEFFWLKVSELMLFLFWFKSGKYGRFYGTVDPLVIMEALREFLKERAVQIDKFEQEKREERERESKPMPYEEYQRMKAEGKIKI